MNNVFVYCEMEGKHVADVSWDASWKQSVPAATLPM